MSDPLFVVGIDLGTSNCAVAYSEIGPRPKTAITDFPVLQLLRPGEVAVRSLLPSCLYLPGESEFPSQAIQLPWPASSNAVVGEFARWNGARVPGRLVSSAKSWLCHSQVDRTAPILPWGAPLDVPKLSPVRASALLLEHLAKAWDHAHPEAPLVQQDAVITVPASFDEVARALTVNAARQAGFERFTLLEEPQAAFYDFTARHQEHLAESLREVRLVLVVDVGGGTSDFTLVQVSVSPEGPILRRLAVGEHLILGGDNMDAALARRAEERMLSGTRKLQPSQWTQLLQAARQAKESLLAQSGAGQFHLSVAASGSQLLGQALSTYLTAPEVEALVLDGFFPLCSSEERPLRGSRVALQEIGLPYSSDPAITRHLAAFLDNHRQAAFAALGEAPSNPSQLPRPDALLLNGGVFNSSRIARRMLEALSHWWPELPAIRLLEHDSLDLAVARGAAYYGLVRRGLGQRITGGAAHALYVGLEHSAAGAAQALCVVSRGQEEGTPVDLGERIFQLTLERPVRFPLFSSASDRVDRVGQVVSLADDMDPLPSIYTVLKSKQTKGGQVPVHLRAMLTEIGTLELWCVSNAPAPEQWRLEFEVRASPFEQTVASIEPMHPRFDEARSLAQHVFGNRPGSGRTAPHPNASATKELKALWSSLELTLGPRAEWRLPVLRELWSVLFSGAARRRRSADHERIFFQMLGFALRPGFGYPLDEWRCEQTARLFPEGIHFTKEKPVWTEFWILWRRIAGGLGEPRHVEIWDFLKPHLAHRVPPNVPKHIAKPKGVQPEGLDEMVRLAAALELVDVPGKTELGDWIAARLRSGGRTAGPWTWALGRLGARTPLFGSAHKVVAPDKASEWIELLLQPEITASDGALFALAQLARLTADRARDIDPALRERVLEAFQQGSASPSWIRLVSEVVPMEATDRARALGDTLPVGLQLASFE